MRQAAERRSGGGSRPAAGALAAAAPALKCTAEPSRSCLALAQRGGVADPRPAPSGNTQALERSRLVQEAGDFCVKRKGASAAPAAALCRCSSWRTVSYSAS